MKRTFATRGIQSLLAMFFLVGGLFVMTANRAEAQQTLSAPANQSWKSTDDAIAVITQTITNNHQTLAATQPGSNAYDAALARVIFYKTTYTHILDGAAVGDAVMQTRMGLSDSGKTDNLVQGIQFTKPLLSTLLTEATNLLTN